MDQRRYTQVQRVRTATHAQLRASVDTLMPESAAAAFWRWALEPDTAQCEEWLQLMGVNQLAILTLGLADGIIPEEHWDAIMPQVAQLNTYLTYEVVSDNVAMGCAAFGLPATDARRSLLSVFNTAVVARLTGAPGDLRDDLPHVVAAMQTISLADQSLTAPHMHALIATFQHTHPQLAHVEYDLWPLLIANGEAAHRVAMTVTEDPFRDLVTSGLIARYAGVNRLVQNEDATWEERLRTGRDTILVQPVLAYYAALLHRIMPSEPLDAQDLSTALEQAALLVRLLNDLGTPIVEMTDHDRGRQIQQLQQQAAQSGAPILADVFRTAPDPTLWTRILKDLDYGEWNIALDLLPAHDPVPRQLDALEYHLHQAAEVYAATQRQFASVIARLQDSGPLASRIAALTQRFVQFHRTLYRQSFTSASGEYASAENRGGRVVALKERPH